MRIGGKYSGPAATIAATVIDDVASQVGQANGIQSMDPAVVAGTVGRLMALATSRAQSPDSQVDVDIMVSRTKEGRRFTVTCQIDIEPAVMNGDESAQAAAVVREQSLPSLRNQAIDRAILYGGGEPD